MPSVLLRVPGLDPFDLDPEAQPPHGQLAQPVNGMRRRKRDAVVGPNHVREAKFLEGALKDREGELLLGGQQRLARQQVAAREVGDGQRPAEARGRGRAPDRSKMNNAWRIKTRRIHRR